MMKPTKVRALSRLILAAAVMAGLALAPAQAFAAAVGWQPPNEGAATKDFNMLPYSNFSDSTEELEDGDSLVVRKVWKDDANADGKRPSSVTINIDYYTGVWASGNAVVVGHEEITLTPADVDPDDPNVWSTTVTVPAGTGPVHPRVSEQAIAGYKLEAAKLEERSTPGVEKIMLAYDEQGTKMQGNTFRRSSLKSSGAYTDNVVFLKKGDQTLLWVSGRYDWYVANCASQAFCETDKTLTRKEIQGAEVARGHNYSQDGVSITFEVAPDGDLVTTVNIDPTSEWAGADAYAASYFFNLADKTVTLQNVPGGDPAPAPEDDPEPSVDPDPEPGTDPDPSVDPDPEPGTDPDPAPSADPEPDPQPAEQPAAEKGVKQQPAAKPKAKKATLPATGDAAGLAATVAAVGMAASGLGLVARRRR